MNELVEFIAGVKSSGIIEKTESLIKSSPYYNEILLKINDLKNRIDNHEITGMNSLIAAGDIRIEISELIKSIEGYLSDLKSTAFALHRKISECEKMPLQTLTAIDDLISEKIIHYREEELRQYEKKQAELIESELIIPCPAKSISNITFTGDFEVDVIDLLKLLSGIIAGEISQEVIKIDQPALKKYIKRLDLNETICKKHGIKVKKTIGLKIKKKGAKECLN